ncbi:MAG: diguanylate cyclase response regulator, partial [Marinobacter sp.]|nr:diguanylate cyclase response regulator [Marinobacter sp.]
MSDPSQQEKLRQHFARRVTTQARVVLDTWQKIHGNSDSFTAHREEFTAATDKLVRYAHRFEMADHAAAGGKILELLRNHPANTALDVHSER